MATSNSAQPMSKREKIKYLIQVLYGLSDSNSRKGTYSLPEVAKALYEKIVLGTSWAKLPKSEHYRRETAFQYWYKKLKDSGKFQEVRAILRK
jgi:hypothetical protein